jgi:two-component system nitrate/nitrite response regulator NarL
MIHPPYNIIIIDDHPLFRKGVGELISSDDSFDLVGEAASGTEGIKLALELKPDLILLDMHMKDMTGIQVLAKLKEHELDALIILLTVSNAEEDLVAAMRGGASGYLLKDMQPDQIISKLKQAAEGQVVLTDELATMLAQALRENNLPNQIDDDTLTNREWEIVKLIADGLSNKMIANTLGITDGTVKVHVRNLMTKLNMRSRLEAAVWYLGNRADR